MDTSSSSFPDFGPHSNDHHRAIGLTSGFGTLLQEEHRLQTALSSSIAIADDLPAPNIARILRHQHERVAGIAASLKTQYDRFPSPGRFHSVETDAALLTHRPDQTVSMSSDPLLQLASQHEELVRRMESLLGHEGHPRTDTLLGQAVHQHREMAWLLGALFNEREWPGDTFRSAPRTRAGEEPRSFPPPAVDTEPGSRKDRALQ